MRFVTELLSMRETRIDFLYQMGRLRSLRFDEGRNIAPFHIGSS